MDIKDLICRGNAVFQGLVNGRDIAADGAKLDNIANSKGQINGYASLDGSGKVPSTQLPAYVDDVIEGYFNTGDSKFYVEDTYVTEILGETGKIYVSLDTNKSYRWSGSAFIYITSGAVDSVNGETGLVDLKHYTCDDLVTLTNLLAEKTGNILIELTKDIALPTTTFTINENLANIWIRNYEFKIPQGGGQIIFSASNNCTISILSGMSLSGMGSCNVQLDSVGFSMILRLRYFSSYVSSFTKTVGTTGTVLIEFGTGYKLPNGGTLDTFELNSRWFTPTILDKLLAESTSVTEIANDSVFFLQVLGELKRIRWSNILNALQLDKLSGYVTSNFAGKIAKTLDVNTLNAEVTLFTVPSGTMCKCGNMADSTCKIYVFGTETSMSDDAVVDVTFNNFLGTARTRTFTLDTLGRDPYVFVCDLVDRKIGAGDVKVKVTTAGTGEAGNVIITTDAVW